MRSHLKLVLKGDRGIVGSTLECAACSQAWGCQQEQVLGSGLGPVGSSLSWCFFFVVPILVSNMGPREIQETQICLFFIS